MKALKGSALLKRPSDVLSLLDKRGDRYVAVLLEDDSSYVGREVLSAPLLCRRCRQTPMTVATSASALGACVLRSLILGIACVSFSTLTREDSFTEKTVGTGWGAASQGRPKQLLRAAASPGRPGGLTADVVPRTHSVPEGVLCLVGAMVQTLSAVFWTPNFMPNPVPFSWLTGKGCCQPPKASPVGRGEAAAWPPLTWGWPAPSDEVGFGGDVGSTAPTPLRVCTAAAVPALAAPGA